MSAAPAFCAENIRALLETRWLARELCVLDEADSTNRVAIARAARGAAHGATVIADAQRAGRGRHGRSFFSPAGCNLYSSTLLRAGGVDEARDGRAPCGAQHGARARDFAARETRNAPMPAATAQTPPRAQTPVSPTAVLAAGVAVAECVAEELGARDRVSIKWPNDVQIDGLKCSGILMESLGDATGAVLGIGVNLNLARAALPAELRARATTLASALGREISRAQFAARLYGRLESLLDLNARAGFAPVRARLEGFLKMRGARVRVNELDGRTRSEGVVLGLGEDGSLRLRGAGGEEERVLAGDVTLAREAADAGAVR